MGKRKVGDEIHFIADNKVMCEVIGGITTSEGTVVGLHLEHKLEAGVIKTKYHYGNYKDVNAEDVFDTREALRTSLFDIK